VLRGRQLSRPNGVDEKRGLAHDLAAAGQPAQHEARISCFGKVEVTIAEGLNLAGDLVGLRARCQRETGGRYY
jgi:hypothetical protein